MFTVIDLKVHLEAAVVAVIVVAAADLVAVDLAVAEVIAAIDLLHRLLHLLLVIEVAVDHQAAILAIEAVEADQAVLLVEEVADLAEAEAVVLLAEEVQILLHHHLELAAASVAAKVQKQNKNIYK